MTGKMREEKSRLVYSTDVGPEDRKKAGREKQKPSGKGIKKASAGAGPSAGQQKLHLRLERKGRGGKTVTLVCGLGLPGNEMESLLKDIKTRLGTGGALKDNMLELQGGHRDAIAAVLREKGLKI